jgi:hypothetical protein
MIVGVLQDYKLRDLCAAHTRLVGKFGKTVGKKNQRIAFEKKTQNRLQTY